MSGRSDKAALKFCDSLQGPQTTWPLIRAAFALYEADWRSPGDLRDKIAGWNWPADELARGGEFKGEQPWTVLLRRAVELARDHARV